MRTITITADVLGAVAEVFELLVDLRGYGRWLGSSREYSGTVEISAGDVRPGTTYVEHSRVGVRRGTVTELRAPEHVVFHQPMHLRPAPAGVIDIVVDYTLRQEGEHVRVERTVHIGLPRVLTPFASLVCARFRRESDRTVAALKDFVEKRRG